MTMSYEEELRNQAIERERLAAMNMVGTPTRADNPPTIVEQAIKTARGSREGEYGHPALNFANESLLVTAYLKGRGLLKDGAFVDMADVAWLAVIKKIAREMNQPKFDNVLDTIGYVDCLDRINAKLRDVGVHGGVGDLRRMDEHGYLNLVNTLLREE